MYSWARSGVMRPVFFFQAEDGIRVGVASRGLGDVYKGQVLVDFLGLPFMLYHLLSSIITFTVLGFPIYCALSSKTNDTYILNQRKELEI